MIEYPSDSTSYRGDAAAPPAQPRRYEPDAERTVSTSKERVEADLADAHQRLERLAALLAAGAQAAAAACVRIADPAGLLALEDPDCLDGDGRGLRPWLDDLASAAAVASRAHDVAYGLAKWRELANRTEEKLRELVATNSAPLAEHDKLSGRLRAFRHKAGDIGRLEDCSALYAQARDVLETVPTDLAEARRLVASYTDCVNRRTPGEQ